MGQFRKKPVVIEALQVTKDTLFEVATWCDGTVVGAGTPRAGILINTLEGTMRADLGDWVIRGIKGEFYPCKPDIFEATYDPVEDTETLEAGEVVPLALVDSIIREVLTNEEKYVPAAMLGNQGLNAYHGIMREIRNALSRLQQNGGEGR